MFRGIFKHILSCLDSVIILPDIPKSVLSSIFSILGSGQSQLPQEYHQHYQQIIDTASLLGIELSHLTILQGTGSDLQPVDYVTIPFKSDKIKSKPDDDSDNEWNDNTEDTDYFDDIKPDSPLEESYVDVKNEISNELNDNSSDDEADNGDELVEGEDVKTTGCL